MRTTAFLQAALAGSIVLGGCWEATSNRPPFIHRHAVFLAEAGNDRARSPVAGNHSIKPDGTPGRYAGALGLGSVKIQYQFIGTAFCPIPGSDKREWHDVDVYVVVLSLPERQGESIPVIYRGGKQVVIDRSEVRMVIDDTRPAAEGPPSESPASARAPLVPKGSHQ